jgi:beta-lactamase class A
VRAFLAFALLVAALLAPAPAAAESPPAPDCSVDEPFTPAFAGEIERRYAGHRVTAAVLDLSTGCAYSFRPGERVTTASVLKV